MITRSAGSVQNLPGTVLLRNTFEYHCPMVGIGHLMAEFRRRLIGAALGQYPHTHRRFCRLRLLPQSPISRRLHFG